ncbi:hypothetical protein HNY73_006084 [Argiope bruennichi]|uniref:Uncharacterized protein n=1 Tax=Argiope bruennichi TaxID=94029 RepID=A0A8T0FLR5_ARGBR|nr:hypothetical protein HNY73_006084 [Argiope bruennichi]
MDFMKSFNTFFDFLAGIWNPELRKREVYKPKLGLELLFLAWFPANLFVRRSLANVECLHDYAVAPNPGEVPFHDVKDKMKGSIRMLCFWINVNILHRSGLHFLLFLNGVLDYIKSLGHKTTKIQPSCPNAGQDAENNGQVLPPEDSQEDPTVEQNEEQSGLETFEKASSVVYSSSVHKDTSQVAASGCIAW